MIANGNSVRRSRLRGPLLALLVALVPACTDLTEVPEDALSPDNAFKTEAEIAAGVVSVYAQLRSTMWSYYNLSEVTSDEIVVPTRGVDWFDGGRWLELHRQGWTANSGSALNDINGAWNDLYSGVNRANLMVNVLENRPESDLQKRSLAEVRALRGWYYFMLMDFFGRVPLVLTTEVVRQPNVERDSLFRFIERELLAARADLPVTYGAADYGRVTRGAVDAMLATMYLNAEVFTGTVTPTGLTPGQARWDDARKFADSVINGPYSLAANWRDNFDVTNEDSPENVFVIVHVNINGLGMSLPMRTLHYDQLAPSPWNGFATLAETYRAFSDADSRKEIFLVGPQRNFNTGNPVIISGQQLAFTDTIKDIDDAKIDEGARWNKYPPLPGAAGGDAHPNDFAIFRLAEMHLIKAEALARLGQVGPAVIEINRVRARAFNPPQPVAAATQDQALALILNERLFELAGEAKRRRDLIRFGRYTDARVASEKTAQPGYKILFPIPQTQLETNPTLTQNPGYAQ